MNKPDARSISPEAQREKRITAMNMRKRGYTFKSIAEALGVNARTVQKWDERAQTEGEASMISGKARGYEVGKHRQLTAVQESDIHTLIIDRMPDQLKMDYALWTRKAVRDLIEAQTGIHMPIRTVGLYLSRWGFTPQRPAKRAYEQRPAQVQEWLDDTYPLIERRAKAEGATIYWGDETGVTSRCQHGRSFAPQGQTPVVALTAKRFGVNMVSAISNKGELMFMIYRDNFNAERCIDFLERLIAGSNGQRVFLILDNLRVHHAKDVKEWVAKNIDTIELFFLPAYSPELNPDEYLNGDLKNRIADRPQSRNRDALESNVRSIMTELSMKTEHIKSYFRHPKIRYAA
jgi:transposase